MDIRQQTLAIDEATAPRAGAREWVALAVLMLPVLLVSIDNTVLAFALPQISLALEPDAAQQLWMVDAYALVLAGLLVAMGSLGDRFGRRRMLLIGATGFAVVSVLAAFAPTASALIAARAALGLFGAMLMPSTLSLLRSTFPHRDQRRLAIAVWATAFSVGSALGPTVGGLLLEHFAWGSVFLMAVPVLLPLLVLAPLLVRESRDPAPGPIDPLGIALSIAALGALAATIKHVAVEGPDLLAVALLAVAIVAGLGFARRMRSVDEPMLDLDLLRVPAFSGAIAINLLSVVALVGALFFLTQHLQLVEGLSTLDAALLLVPGTIAMVLAGLGVVRIVRHVPAHRVVAVGLASSMAGYLLVALAGDALSPLHVAIAYVLLGAGVGAAETLSNEIVVSTAPPAKAGAASAVSETAYELGAVLGTAVLGGIVSAVYRASIALPDGVASADADAARETLAGALDVAERVQGELGAGIAEAARAAFDQGALWTALTGAALMAAAIVVALRALRRA
ncbi:MFS transporter [Agrococcus sediminis]|uniref:MFS transporter n=1 Tax=Agrococcus sediminis TaxID=2599924 RepID=A0A5M8QCT2_9MICO|nr:MFS transporter [Agrococcus sediminis]KAA6432843.1 MFS transporter [Agrococcus sediminis]